MANPKNSDRRKRKYGDKRKAATERNRKTRRVQDELRQARMVSRTEGLLGKTVEARTSEGKFVGKVQNVLFSNDEEHPRNNDNPPKRKHGAYLEITGSTGVIKRSRHRIKVLS